MTLTVRAKSAGGLVKTRCLARRTGIVLPVVLIVVVMLALGAYCLVQLMMLEAQGAKSYGRMVQAREAADSGVHYVAAVLMDHKLKGTLGSDVCEIEAMFQGPILTRQADASQPQSCRFSVLAPQDGDGFRTWRYGVIDETGKINLNVLADMIHSQNSQRGAGTGGGATWGANAGAANALRYLPNMTREIAAAILDWIDEDDTPREFGAEREYYESRDPPYLPRNGPLHSLEELLLVKGVTPRLLYGEDANRNGVLDPNEDDGNSSYPTDNGDRTLDRGWIPYLTVYSRESNTDLAGQSRINVNSSDLESLYGQLAADPDFGEERARFVVAYRLFGVADSARSQHEASEEEVGVDRSDASILDCVTPAQTGPQPTDHSRSQRDGTEETASDRPGADQPSDAPASEDEPRTIAGMDASNGAQFDIHSVVDLIDVSVAIEIPGQDTPTITPSPFHGDQLDEFLDVVLDRTTTTEETELIGRININTAPRLVLMALPNMTEDIADSITAARSAVDRSGVRFGLLLSGGPAARRQFKSWEPFITQRSQVYRVQVVGHFVSEGPVARVEAVIDVSRASPRIRLWRDLSGLGRGFAPSALMGNAGR